MTLRVGKAVAMVVRLWCVCVLGIHERIADAYFVFWF